MRSLGGRNGIVAVFELLNRLSRLPGLRVQGVILTEAASGVSARAYTELFGIEFPAALDSERVWARTLRTQGVGSPALLFVRKGRLEGLLWGEAATGSGGFPFGWDRYAAVAEGVAE